METSFIIPQEITASLGIQQVIDIRDRLPVNPNYTWAQLERLRDIKDITTLVLHHDALTKASSAKYSDVELAQNIAKNHIRGTGNVPNGDAGFPYDIWIRNGLAYQCNDFLPLKYGVKSNNTYTLHICVSGEYSNYDVLADPDRKALIGVLMALKVYLPAYKGIKAHKELTPTQCPGYDYNAIRNDVATAEINLVYKASDQAQNVVAFTIASRILDLYDKAKGTEKYSVEAKRKLLLLQPVMKELGLL